MHTINGLSFHGEAPPGIHHEHVVCNCQIQSDTASSQADQKHTRRGTFVLPAPISVFLKRVRGMCNIIIIINVLFVNYRGIELGKNRGTSLLTHRAVKAKMSNTGGSQLRGY
ncbi:hypothetical protein H106_03236 [Trichophyton rubrum CBS 735.88]|nr:hypothetical protein H106_03236 [Trichophyton rubrum CBS 735.88]